MSMFGKIVIVFLGVLTAFLAVTAIAGGVALLTGWMSMPRDYLHGVFSSYLVPALCLLIVVGGSATSAFVLLIRKDDLAVLFAATSGIIIMFFEFVEVQVIGTPAGPAQFLQIFYFALGTLIAVVAFVIWLMKMMMQTV